MMKECPEGKVLNPKTRRCNKIVASKQCPEGKIMNEKSGRCIKKPTDAMGLDRAARKEFQEILAYLRQPKLKGMFDKQPEKPTSIEQCLKMVDDEALARQIRRRQQPVHILAPRKKK